MYDTLTNLFIFLFFYYRKNRMIRGTQSAVCETCDKPNVNAMMDTRLQSFLDHAKQSTDVPGDFLITGSWAHRHYLQMLDIPQQLIPDDFDLIIPDDELRSKKRHVVGRMKSGITTTVNEEKVDMISPEMINRTEQSIFQHIERQRDQHQQMIDIVNLVSLYEYGFDYELNERKLEERTMFIDRIKSSDLYIQEKLKEGNSTSLQKKKKKAFSRRVIPFKLG
jgi:hypothetical protein